MDFIPYGRQSIDQQDVDAVVQTLTSNYLTTGPKVKAFEEAVANYCGADYCVAVANGTAALHLVSLVLLDKDDKVLTTPNSFLATSNSILYAGAKPVFVDITKDGNIDLDRCEAELKKDPSIKALYAVAFSGNMLDQEKLRHLKETYNIVILEDCAHAIGAKDGDIKAASCTYSDAAILSFHPVKHITTGEGGAITTNSKEIYEKLLQLRNHGITKEASQLKNSDMAYDIKGNLNPWYYEMNTLGYNYRITDFQCALGLSQFEKLDSFVAKRRALAQKYAAAFAENDLVEPLYPYDDHSSYHLYIAKVAFEKLTITKAELFEKLWEKQIGLQLHYIPINKQPYYQDLGYGNEETPVMDEYYEKCLSLPMYPHLSHEEQQYVITMFMEILNGHKR